MPEPWSLLLTAWSSLLSPLCLPGTSSRLPAPSSSVTSALPGLFLLLLTLQPLAIFPLTGSNMAPSAGRLGQGKPLSTHTRVLSILAQRLGHRLGLRARGNVRCLTQLPAAFVWWLARGTISGPHMCLPSLGACPLPSVRVCTCPVSILMLEEV